MSDFKLTITRIDPNPKFDPEKDYRYQNYGERPEPTISVEALHVLITDEQFKAIRKAVLEAF